MDEVYESWFYRFQHIIKTHIPNKIVVIRPKDKPWMNSTIRKAIRKRNRLLKIHCKRKTPTSWLRYKSQRNYTTSVIRDAKRAYYNKLNIQLTNPRLSKKKWWSYTRSLFNKNHESSIPVILEGTELVSDPKTKAEIFNEYFASQAMVDDTNVSLPEVVDSRERDQFSMVETTKQEVLYLMKNVDISKACGHDAIGNKIIKDCSFGLAESFTRLINLSFARGEFPLEWKKANVIPLYKKDNCQIKINYRPISLLSSLSKIPEKVVFSRLYEFLQEIGFLYRYQSGFRPGDSTVYQLTLVVHKIY